MKQKHFFKIFKNMKTCFLNIDKKQKIFLHLWSTGLLQIVVAQCDDSTSVE